MINLMLCGNDKVYDGIFLNLLSICKNTEEALNVYIITMDLTDVNANFKPITKEQCALIERNLKKKNNQSVVSIIDATLMYKEMMEKNVNSKTLYTPYIFLRLLSDKFEELPSKILYLDADIICYKNINELFSIDMSNYEIAAARDFIGRKWINRNYLNSGVLLINLENVKETNSFEKSRNMCMTKRMLLPDQTALNRCCERKLILEDRFNEQKKRKKETVLRHFSKELLYLPIIRTRNIKPWEIEKVHNILKINDYDDIYEEFLKAKNVDTKSENKCY